MSTIRINAVQTLTVPGYIERPAFGYSSTTAITIGPFTCELQGATTRLVYCNSGLTFTFGSGGSNAASSDLSASAWFYLYLDDSTISADEVSAASKFVANTTAPTWSDSKRGWYNGSDRCLGAFLTNGSSELIAFYHDGKDYISYDDQQVTAISATDIDDTFTDCTLIAPNFGDNARVRISTYTAYSDGAASLFWRKNGSSATTGHMLGNSNANNRLTFGNAVVFVDTAQKIEIMHHNSNGNTATVLTNGYFFPRGM